MPQDRRPNVPGMNGVVTFLFTDVEGSTRLWDAEPERMKPALAAHDALARSTVESHRGTVVKMTGDGLHAAFDDPLDALAATVDLQRALVDPAATHGVSLRVRCGLHAGVVERRDDDYFGGAVNRAARIMTAAHGGQVLVSQAVFDVVRETLPDAVSLRDLGKVRLRDLSAPEHLYQVVHPQLRQEFPALRSLEAIPNNLSQQVTSFVGREKELPTLRRLLSGTALLTLTGAGGCGKTRLALQVAAESLEHFPDGTWLVELAPLADADLVAPTLARVLGLKEATDKPIVQTLCEHLKDKRVLLLLDNCEHVLQACAELVDTIVRRCPQVRILATSREAIGIGGEQAYRVPSLSLPDPRDAPTRASVTSFEAVQLFNDRALLCRPEFEVTEQNAATIASICHQLDGIPLAIELAAARVRSLSVEEVHRKLDQRFVLLTAGSRTALPRQQTLRALIDWSYDLLREPEKQLLQRLSVFAGGWTLATAEQVCGPAPVAGGVLDLLTSLCDKSLVVVVEQGDGDYRYRLLETVRQYALEKLAESGTGQAVRRRHRNHYLALAEEAGPKITGAGQVEWLKRLEDEHENLRSGLEWSIASADTEEGLRLCGALGAFWTTRGHLSEGRKWCARVLAMAGHARTRARAKALNAAGTLAYRQSDYCAAQAQDAEALATWRHLGDRSGIATSLSNLGKASFQRGDYASARSLLEESLAISRAEGDRRGIAASLNNLGNLDIVRGDLASARPLYEECLAIMRELHDAGGASAVLGNLGIVAREQGDYPGAETLIAESLAILRRLNDQLGIAIALINLGRVATLRSDFAVARALYAESLGITRERGNSREIAYSLEGLASAVTGLGDSLRAARIWGIAERLREEIGTPLPPYERPHYERRAAAARAALQDDAAFDRAWQDGRAMPIDEAIAFALEAT